MSLTIKELARSCIHVPSVYNFIDDPASSISYALRRIPVYQTQFRDKISMNTFSEDLPLFIQETIALLYTLYASANHSTYFHDMQHLQKSLYTSVGH